MAGHHFIWIVLILLLVSACRKEDGTMVPEPAEPLLSVPAGFPEPEFPPENEFTEARWILGKKLFFDPVMSRNNELNCASCHLPSNAFSDTVSMSPGVDGRAGTRNAPSLANIAYHPYFTREGGVPTLEMQVLVPVQEHNEFDFNILDIADRLKADADYRELAMEAYGRLPDHYVITRALATFERSLLSGTSPYDNYLSGAGAAALTKEALSGMELFFSERTSCSDCHGGFNFTGYAFENNGLYEAYADPGRFRLTNNEADKARFKVPSLRNAAVTAPYMHDGSIATLAEVVAHYNSGGQAHPQKSELIRPLNLSEEEMAALVAFIESLTDHAFINNEKFRP